MAIAADELAAIDLLRSMQHRPPLAAHEAEALGHEPAPQAGPAELPPPSPEEAQALAYIRGLEPAPAAAGPLVPPLPDAGRLVGKALDTARSVTRAIPAMSEAEGHEVDAAALATAGYPGPLTATESARLAELAAEYVELGQEPMTSTRATEIILTLRRRAA